MLSERHGLPQLDRIDVDYVRLQKRYDTSALTRVSATEAGAAEWMASGGKSARGALLTPDTAQFHPNFITEVFFLALRLQSLALGRVVRRLEEKEKEMERLKKRINELESDRRTWEQLPQSVNFEHAIKRAQAQTDKLRSGALAAQTQLFENDFVQRVTSFASFVMVWLVRVADPTMQHPQTTVKLPLPSEVPDRFAMLPEHIFEDTCDILLFYARCVRRA